MKPKLTLNPIRFAQETTYTCGPAALRTVGARLGIKKSEKTFAKLLQDNRVSGVAPASFAGAVQKLKLTFFAKDHAGWSDLGDALKTHQVIIGYFLPWEKIGHFAVVEHVTQNAITLFDPLGGKIREYKRSYFERLWRRGFRYDLERNWFCGIKK